MTDDKTKDKVYVQIADLFQKASAAQLSRMQMYGGDIRSTFRTVTHLSFFLSFFLPLMFMLFTDGGETSQHHRHGEIRSQPQWTLPQGQHLIDNLHISKPPRLKSDTSVFFKKAKAIRL